MGRPRSIGSVVKVCEGDYGGLKGKVIEIDEHSDAEPMYLVAVNHRYDQCTEEWYYGDEIKSWRKE